MSWRLAKAGPPHRGIAVRMNPLPNHPAVLESHLAAISPWLESVRVLHGELAELDDSMNRVETKGRSPSHEQAGKWLRRNEETRARAARVKFYQPQDQNFWSYAD